MESNKKGNVQFLIFVQSVVLLEPLAHFLSPNPKTEKKYPPLKKIVVFQEMELSSSNIKK